MNLHPKRPVSAILSAAMLLGIASPPVQALDSGAPTTDEHAEFSLCSHHETHTEECGGLTGSCTFVCPEHTPQILPELDIENESVPEEAPEVDSVPPEHSEEQPDAPSETIPATPLTPAQPSEQPQGESSDFEASERVSAAPSASSNTVVINKQTPDPHNTFVTAAQKGNTTIRLEDDVICNIQATTESNGRMKPVHFGANTVVTGSGTVTSRAPIQLDGDVTFENISLTFSSSDELNSVPHREIFLAGHHLTLDNVQTNNPVKGGMTITETNLLPTVFAGSYKNSSSDSANGSAGNHAQLTVRNSNSTKFQAIYLSHTGTTEGPQGIVADSYAGNATLSLDASAKLEDGSGTKYPKPSGIFSEHTTGQANITFTGTNQSAISSFRLKGNDKTHLKLIQANMGRNTLEGTIGSLTIGTNSIYEPSNNLNTIQNIIITDGGILKNPNNMTVQNFTGDANGNAVIQLDQNTSLTINGTIQNTAKVQVPFSIANLSNPFITANSTISEEPFSYDPNSNQQLYTLQKKIEGSSTKWYLKHKDIDMPQLGSMLFKTPSGNTNLQSLTVDVDALQGSFSSERVKAVGLTPASKEIPSDAVDSFLTDNVLCVKSAYWDERNTSKHDAVTDWYSDNLSFEQDSTHIYKLRVNAPDDINDYTLLVLKENSDMPDDPFVNFGTLKGALTDDKIAGSLKVSLQKGTLPPADAIPIQAAHIKPFKPQPLNTLPLPTITVNGKVLEKDTDYTLSTVGNQQTGFASLFIQGKGKYTTKDESNGQLMIGYHAGSYNLSNATSQDLQVSPIEKQIISAGGAATPSVTVTTQFGNHYALKQGEDYTLSYKNNTTAGTGTAVISGTGMFSGQKEVSFTIEVSAKPAPTEVKIHNAPTSPLKKGDTVTLQASVLPAEAEQGIIWSSETPDLASVVPETGLVTALAKGQARIKATSKIDSGKFASVTIDITEDPAPSPAITIQPQEMTLEVGQKNTFTASVSNSSSNDVTWEVQSGEAFASIDASSGEVTAKQTGTAIVKATSTAHPTVSATATVRVIEKPKPNQPVITITPPKMSLKVGESQTFTAQITPADSDDKIIWSVENGANLIDIDASTGKVTAKSKGSASVKAASSKYPASSATAVVEVTDSTQPDIPVQSVQIDGGDFSIEKGKNKTLTATVLPQTATNRSVTWSSSHSDIASIDPKTGMVTAHKEGQTTITATADDNPERKDTRTVTVIEVPITSLKINESILSLREGRSAQLTVQIAPDNATNAAVKWTSDDENVISVTENGYLTAHNKGVATITVTSVAQPEMKDSRTISVTASSSGGGSSSGGSSSGGSSSGGSSSSGSSKPSKPNKPAKPETKPEQQIPPSVTPERPKPGVPIVNTAPPVNSAIDTSFTDIPQTHWASAPIQDVVSRGLFVGTKPGTFSPNESMSRSMLVTVLYRLAGEPAVQAVNHFNDVGRTYYTDAVTWASENQIVSGTSSNTFSPNLMVTREELVVMLYRLANPVPNASAKLTGFSDTAKVSSWASASMQWAVENEILKGSNGALLPQQKLTRAEAASLISRFTEKILHS
ncbi:MAG: Ig-like domain-containing protein [Butyricicoccus sp.]